MLRGVRRVHFVGIGGAGMCALAEILLRQGYAVRGSDRVASAATARLAALGAAVRHGHAPEAIDGADLVVASSAIRTDNAELAAARSRGVPTVARGALLAALMRGREGVAVAGSHGKTTTASLIVAALAAAGSDPTFLIGATLCAAGGNAGLGQGRHLVAEADESDASFLQLGPRLAVVTNIDRDHLDAYGQSYARLQAAFADFVSRLPADGAAVLCADDAGAAGLARHVRGRTLTYGLGADAEVRGSGVALGADGSRFGVADENGRERRIRVPLPGLANVSNALAALAACRALGVPEDAAAAGIEGFAGVQRRFQVAACAAGGKRFTLVDDYGHHPTELAHVIDTVREVWPGRRLVMVFQPHRYTRTRDLMPAFAAELRRVDELVLAEVYAASEAPIAGADGAALATAVAACGSRPHLAATPAEALERLRAVLADGDVVAVQGAGDVADVAAALRRGGSE